jgi:sorting and assembly machinery component 37
MKFITRFWRELVLPSISTLDSLDRNHFSTMIGMYFLHKSPILSSINNHRPTTLDVLLAAHVLLITIPPFPDPLLNMLLVESCPTLVVHANLVRSRTFPPPDISGTEATSAMPPISSPQSYTLFSLLPNPARVKIKLRTTDSAKDEKLRWRWAGITAAGLVGYFMLTGANRVALANGAGEQDEGIEEVAAV